MTASQYLAAWQSKSPRYDHEWQADLCEAFSVFPDASLMNMTYNENKSVQLAAAICAKPDLLILDEPANFLDEKNYAFLLKALKRLNELGMTILLAAEKYADAKGYCHRYAYLKGGAVIESGNLTYPGRRHKIVLVSGGNKTYLEQNMSGIIEDAFVKDEYFEAGYAKSIYLYSGDMRRLPDLIRQSECRDFVIEEMTFEEEIDMDFSRWSHE
jgi:ABC-type multidrug transport system ATPase subunit